MRAIDPPIFQPEECHANAHILVDFLGYVLDDKLNHQLTRKDSALSPRLALALPGAPVSAGFVWPAIDAGAIVKMSAEL